MNESGEGWMIGVLAASMNQGQKIFPTTSYSLVTQQAVTGGLLTKWVIPTLCLTGKSGGGSFVVVVLWLPDESSRMSPPQLQSPASVRPYWTSSIRQVVPPNTSWYTLLHRPAIRGLGSHRDASRKNIWISVVSFGRLIVGLAKVWLQLPWR